MYKDGSSSRTWNRGFYSISFQKRGQTPTFYRQHDAEGVERGRLFAGRWCREEIAALL